MENKNVNDWVSANEKPMFLDERDLQSKNEDLRVEALLKKFIYLSHEAFIEFFSFAKKPFNDDNYRRLYIKFGDVLALQEQVKREFPIREFPITFSDNVFTFDRLSEELGRNSILFHTMRAYIVKLRDAVNLNRKHEQNELDEERFVYSLLKTTDTTNLFLWLNEHFRLRFAETLNVSGVRFFIDQAKQQLDFYFAQRDYKRYDAAYGTVMDEINKIKKSLPITFEFNEFRELAQLIQDIENQNNLRKADSTEQKQKQKRIDPLNEEENILINPINEVAQPILKKQKNNPNSTPPVPDLSTFKPSTHTIVTSKLLSKPKTTPIITASSKMTIVTPPSQANFISEINSNSPKMEKENIEITNDDILNFLSDLDSYKEISEKNPEKNSDEREEEPGTNFNNS